MFLKLFVIKYKSNVAIAEIDVFILNVLISIVILLYASIIIDSALFNYVHTYCTFSPGTF